MLWFVNSKSQENVVERKRDLRRNSVLFDGMGHSSLAKASVHYYRRLRDLREDHDLTQAQVAEYLEMKQPQSPQKRRILL